jgi:hypothetical protein
MKPDVIHAIVLVPVIGVIAWIVVVALSQCSPPPLPPEGPITVTCSTKDAGR